MLNFASRKNGAIVWQCCLPCLLASLCIVSDLYQFSPAVLLKSSLNNLVAPVKIFANDIIEFPKLILGFIEIQQENKKLRAEIDNLRTQTVAVTNMKRELEELKSSLNFKYPISKTRLIEKVLGYDKSFRESFLLISAKCGETKPLCVVVSNMGLVGIVHEVYRNKVAKVKMVIDNRLHIPVISKSGKRMILAGDGAGGLELVVVHDMINTTIDKLADINIGELLYTSGEGGIFPVNIPVARINKIDTTRGKIFATPVTDFSDLSFVMIVDPILHPSVGSKD
ncbi:MAG: rod shape-determining protein MreC [Holosporales bacterium]|nr:rod shape-determining protein MreC [Holosporales bacterium]